MGETSEGTSENLCIRHVCSSDVCADNQRQHNKIYARLRLEFDIVALSLVLLL